MSLAAMSTALRFATPFGDPEKHNDGTPECDAFQSISGRNIDSSKLLSLLRMKFGAGSYDMHVSYNQPRR
jgi:hypothetical protein